MCCSLAGNVQKAQAAARSRRICPRPYQLGAFPAWWVGSQAAAAAACFTLLPLLQQGGNVEQHRDVLERPAASAALAGVIAFASLTSDGSGLGKHTLALYDPGRCVVFATVLAGVDSVLLLFSVLAGVLSFLSCWQVCCLCYSAGRCVVLVAVLCCRTVVMEFAYEPLLCGRRGCPC